MDGGGGGVAAGDRGIGVVGGVKDGAGAGLAIHLQHA